MKHSVKNRVLIGKTIGLIAGLSVFLILPLMGVSLDLKLGLGLVLFYIFTGALIGFYGMFERHPIFDFKMPWYFRGAVVGLIMHTMLVLLTYDQILALTNQMDILGITCPWWALIDGIILGLVMAFAETKWAGEGKLPLK